MDSGDATTTPLGEPTLPEAAALVFGVSAPNSGFLVALESVLKAAFLHGALAADGLGSGDLVDGGPGASDGEEQVGLRIATEREVAPFPRE